MLDNTYHNNNKKLCIITFNNLKQPSANKLLISLCNYTCGNKDTVKIKCNPCITSAQQWMRSSSAACLKIMDLTGEEWLSPGPPFGNGEKRNISDGR